MTRILVTVILLLGSATLHARMYQWIEQDSGTTQLSGKPPSWYRGTESGPRVFVFDNGRIIDDTGIEVSEAERIRLRQQALLKAEEERDAAREKLLQAERLKATLEQRQSSDQAGETEVPSMVDLMQGLEEEPDKELPDTEGLSAEDMRRLIREWEQRRVDRARELITPD